MEYSDNFSPAARETNNSQLAASNNPSLEAITDICIKIYISQSKFQHLYKAHEHETTEWNSSQISFATNGI